MQRHQTSGTAGGFHPQHGHIEVDSRPFKGNKMRSERDEAYRTPVWFVGRLSGLPITWQVVIATVAFLGLGLSQVPLDMKSTKQD